MFLQFGTGLPLRLYSGDTHEVCPLAAGWEVTLQDPVKYWEEWCVGHPCMQHVPPSKQATRAEVVIRFCVPALQATQSQVHELVRAGHF
jgi:hypothetical protein